MASEFDCTSLHDIFAPRFRNAGHQNYSTLDGDSQITAFASFHVRVPVSDPFTDFMTGKLSERHAKQDQRIFAMMYLGIVALIVLAIVSLLI